MGWGGTLVAFGAPALVLYVTTHVAIPSVTQSLGLPPIVWFMTFSAFYVLGPLLVIALMRLRGEALEDVPVWRERLRFRPLDRLTAADWRVALTALAAASLASAALFVSLTALGVKEIAPTFLQNSGDQALAQTDLFYSLAAFATLSVTAQEILWRGVCLPRQEQSLGAEAWTANAVGWAIFHVAFGWNLLLIMLPVLVAVPYAAQRQRSSSVGVVVHAGAWVVLLALVSFFTARCELVVVCCLYYNRRANFWLHLLTYQ